MLDYYQDFMYKTIFKFAYKDGYVSMPDVSQAES